MRLRAALLALLFTGTARATCWKDTNLVLHCVDEPGCGTLYNGTVFTVTGTAAAGTGVTLTIPASAWWSSAVGVVNSLRISKFVTSAITASGTPIRCTTTNLNNKSYPFRKAGAVGDMETGGFVQDSPIKPLKGAAVNTDITIVCPATSSVLWDCSADYSYATPN